MGTAPSTAAGNPCPVLSRTAWRRCDSRLIGHSAISSRHSADVAGVLNALVGRDVLSEKSDKAEVTGLMPSRPRASRRIGTSFEALRAGPRARRRIGTSSEALRAGPRAIRRIGTSSEALRAGPRARRRIGTSSEALRLGPRARRRIGTSSEALRAGPRAR